MIRHRPVNYICTSLFYAALWNISLTASSLTAIKQGDIINTDLSSLLPETFQLNRIIFSPDISFLPSELDALFPFAPDSLVARKDLERSFWYLKQKNKVEEATLELRSGQAGYELTIHMKCWWTFDRLKIHGILRGKEKYRSLYLMLPGDRFDALQHAASVEKIVGFCRDEGYMRAQAAVHIDYDDDCKSVTVTLKITHGSRFTIGNQLVKCVTTNLDSCDSQELCEQLTQQFLEKHTKRNYDKAMTKKIAQELTQFLLHEGYMDVGIELDYEIDEQNCTVHIIWTVSISHRRTFVFFGNQYFSHQELHALLIKFGKSAGILPASILAEEIERAYKDKGFWSVHIETQEDADKYFFIITEGSRARIKRAIIMPHGHHDVAGAQQAFRGFLHKKYYDVAILQQSFAALLDAYRNAGFLDPRIIRHTFENTRKEDVFELHVEVNEGDIVYIADISIPAFPELIAQGPFAQFYKETQKTLFDPAVIKKQQQWLLKHFHEKGYLKVTVKPEYITVDAQHVNVTWYVDLHGVPLTFGPTIIEGCSPISYTTLVGLLHYQEGQVWNSDALHQTFLELKDLEVFDGINIVPGQSLHNEVQPVIIRLRKDDPYELRLRGGIELQHLEKYRTLNGLSYSAGGTFMVKNPGCVGDRLSIDVDFTRSHHEIIGKYKRPVIFFIPWQLQGQAYGMRYEQPSFIGSNDNIYTLHQNGFLVGLSRKHSMFEGGCNIGLEWMQTSIKDESLRPVAFELARAIDFEPRLLGRMIPYAFIEPTLFIDTLDNKLSPTQGTLTVVSLKGMVPLSKIDSRGYFVRILAQQTAFVPIQKCVAAFRLRIGHIFHRIFSEIMPSERFYLGGSHSLRSYQADAAPPLGVFIQDGKPQLVPRGGKSMMNLNAELRFPLFKYIGGVVFQDVGLLTGDTFAPILQDNWIAGTGFGVRFFTPIGPLRFDIGFKWRTSSPLEPRYAWFLTFGQAF